MVVLSFRKHYNQTNKQTTLTDGLKRKMENKDECITEFENRLPHLDNRNETHFLKRYEHSFVILGI
jgi:hypothetical protein